jgi:hypothetical protein
VRPEGADTSSREHCRGRCGLHLCTASLRWTPIMGQPEPSSKVQPGRFQLSAPIAAGAMVRSLRSSPSCLISEPTYWEIIGMR